jgi:predicted transposase YbfD/YdcC
VPVDSERTGFAHARQAVLSRREVTRKKTGEVTAGRRLFISSVTFARHPRHNAARLAQLVRGHWTVENNIHWLRDAVGREDACRCRHHNQAAALALLRTALLAPVRAAGHHSLTAAVELFAQNKTAALRIIKYQRFA